MLVTRVSNPKLFCTDRISSKSRAELYPKTLFYLQGPTFVDLCTDCMLLGDIQSIMCTHRYLGKVARLGKLIPKKDGVKLPVTLRKISLPP